MKKMKIFICRILKAVHYRVYKCTAILHTPMGRTHGENSMSKLDNDAKRVANIYMELPSCYSRNDRCRWLSCSVDCGIRGHSCYLLLTCNKSEAVFYSSVIDKLNCRAYLISMLALNYVSFEYKLHFYKLLQ